MAEPKVRFKQKDVSSYPTWSDYSIADLFDKVGTKNKDCQNTNVITNSAEFGLIPQRDYFDKDIAVEGKTDNYTIIQKGDFVYNPRKSSYAPMGPFNCYRLDEDGIVSPLYSCLRPKGVLNPEYLLWYFQTDKWYGYVNDHGAQNGARHDRVGMTDKILMGIPVSAPCLEEQQRIADFLSTIDDVIAASDSEVQNLELQKKAVMKKIFAKEVQFTRQDGSSFPEWENVRFGDVFTEIVRKTSDTETYPLFSLTIEDGVTAKTERYERSYLVKKAEDNYKIVPPNAFVYNPMNLRFGALAPSHEDKEVCVSQYYNVFALNDETTLGFWESYLVTDEMLKHYFSIATGSLVEKLRVHYSNFVNIVKPIPCAEEQRLIADFLSDFDKAIAAAKRELELWRELKKGLLQQMFV